MLPDGRDSIKLSGVWRPTAQRNEAVVSDGGLQATDGMVRLNEELQHRDKKGARTKHIALAKMASGQDQVL